MYRRASTRILILGAGYSGLTLALQLGRELKALNNIRVMVIDRNNDLLFTPLLWTVANGRANPNNVVIPIRDFQKGRQFFVRHAEIEQIDLDQKEVRTSQGSLPYDILVIALGSRTAVPDLPGLRQHALPFHTPADALQLRNHLIDAIESAHYATDPAERQEWLTFVVGGAGDTGAELAAIVHDYLLTGLFRAYPWLADAPVRVVMVGRAERILPMSDPRTSHLVYRALKREGIEVLTGRSITGVEGRAVLTSSGTIPARTLFWAAGITAPEVVCHLPVPHARNGAVLVDDHYSDTKSDAESYSVTDTKSDAVSNTNGNADTKSNGNAYAYPDAGRANADSRAVACSYANTIVDKYTSDATYTGEEYRGAYGIYYSRHNSYQ